MMQITAQFDFPNPFASATSNQGDLFNKHVGSSSWWREITQKGANANRTGFVVAWQRQARQFQIQSRNYWLYE
jgi:hypothetical protein